MSTFDVASLAEVFGDDIVHDDDGSVTTLTHGFGAEDFLRGHFPDFPVVPGVILLDGMMLAGLHAVQRGAGCAPAAVRTITVDAVTFHRPVLPGRDVRFTARIAERRAGGIAARCAVMVHGARHARASMTFRFESAQS